MTNDMTGRAAAFLRATRRQHDIQIATQRAVTRAMSPRANVVEASGQGLMISVGMALVSTSTRRTA